MANEYEYIVKFVPEYEIDEPIAAQIAALLDESFPETSMGQAAPPASHQRHTLRPRED
jgi:hypothetical protein